ncbi:MAG: hypothetical protein IT344_09425 [Candidatus Dadabacteria bacterium]|nr:hypothetical protein [Candidatus Dadabacteria bacterium]
MSEQGKEQHGMDIKKMFELDEREKVGAIYIVGVVALILLIIGLASLTHVVLTP